jgi:hypothetical protein
MATTTNYGWDTPDDTDLVKDGAAAIRTLGSSIDTTTKNLNPQTTTGAIAYRSATSNVNTSLPLGTAGQVLTVNSGATAPEWATPAAGGGMTSIASGTLNNTATVSLTSISASYKNLILILRDFTPATDNSFFKTRVNNITTTSYRTFVGSLSGGAYDGTEINTVSFLSNVDKDNFIQLEFFDYANTTINKMVEIKYNIANQATTTQRDAGLDRGAVINTTSAINRIDFYMDSGNMTSGTYILYGVN